MSDFSHLSGKIGIDFQKELDAEKDNNGTYSIQKVAPSNGELEIVPADRQKDEEEDYQKTREIYSKVAEIGIENLQRISDVAEYTSEPRAFEVVAIIMKSLNETAKNLSDIHASRKPETGEKSSINVDKAVFVGSQADLLKAIKESNDRNS